MSKYRNKPTTVDGIKFQSKKEAERFIYLRWLASKNGIYDLKRQVRYRLDVNGIKICTYVADFTYLDQQKRLVVEDVKSQFTKKLAPYRIKKSLMKAVHKIDIVET